MSYTRKTKDEFHLLANYGYGHGWEYVISEDSRAEIKKRLKEYRENQGQYSYTIKQIRTPVFQPDKEMLTLSKAKEFPILHSGHCENIIFENEKYRVTISRMTIQDGMEYNNEITVLKLVKGLWKEINKYEPK
jgi:hypothetical protein